MFHMSREKQRVLGLYNNGSNTRIGINDNTHLNNLGIYTTCRIRKGTFVCNLPSKKIFDAGDTVELTTRDLNCVTNICALETIKRRIAPDIKANGSIINWPIPEGGLNNMDQSFYLSHANKGEDANLEFVSSNDSKQIQSQGFDTHKLSRDVDAGVELILPYCELTSKALKAGEKFIDKRIKYLKSNPNKTITLPRSLSDKKRKIINHLNNDIAVQLQPSKLTSTTKSSMGVGVHVMKYGEKLLKKGKDPFAAPEGINQTKTIEYTFEQLDEHLTGENGLAARLMIEKMIDPHYDFKLCTTIYPLPVSGPCSLGMAYLFNSDYGLSRNASLEPEKQEDDNSKCLSKMILKKSKFKVGEELLGGYVPAEFQTCEEDEEEEEEDDDEEEDIEEELDEEFKGVFYDAVLALTGCEKEDVLLSADSDSDSDSNSNSESKDVEYDNETLLLELKSATCGPDMPKDMAGKIIYKKMQEDNEDVENFEFDQLAICVLILFGEVADEISIPMLEDDIIDAINKSDSSDDDSDDEGTKKVQKRKRSSRSKSKSKKKRKTARGKPTDKSVRFGAIDALQDGDAFQGITTDDEEEDGCAFTGNKPSPRKRKTKSTSLSVVKKSWHRLSRKEQQKARGFRSLSNPNPGKLYVVRDGAGYEGGIIGKYSSILRLKYGIGVAASSFYEKDVDVVNGYVVSRPKGNLFISIYNSKKDPKWEDIENNEVKLNAYKRKAGGGREGSGAEGPYLVYPSNESDGKALLRKCENTGAIRKPIKKGGLGPTYKGEILLDNVKWNKGPDNTEYIIWKKVFRIEKCTMDRYKKREKLDTKTLRTICAREKKNDAHIKGNRARNKRQVRDSWNLE